MVEGVGPGNEKDMPEIDEIIEEIDSLKPVSRIGEKIVEIASRPDGSLEELADIVKYDQNITANLLKICNSTYFGLAREIVSVKQAVAFLGLEKVTSLIMIGNSADNFKQAQAGYDLDEGELWRYSVSCALLSQELAERTMSDHVSLIFTSALVKDIGKVILSRHVRDSFLAINKLVQEMGLTFIDAEKEIIGIDHAELGARVAEKWNFSPSMVNIIRYHHSPEKSENGDLSIPIVYLADCICMMMGIGVGSDGLAYKYSQFALDRLHFTDVDLQRTMAGFNERFAFIEELVNLSGGK